MLCRFHLVAKSCPKLWNIKSSSKKEVEKKWEITAQRAVHFCPSQLEEGHSRLVLLSPVFLFHKFKLFHSASLKQFLCLCRESLPSLFWLHRMHIAIVLSFTQTVCPLRWCYAFISMVGQKIFLILIAIKFYVLDPKWVQTWTWMTFQDLVMKEVLYPGL